MAGGPAISIEGLKEMQSALRKVGGTPDDQRKLNRQVIDELIIPRAKVEVPVRSGALKRSIRSDAGPSFGWVLAGRAGTLNYAGTVHFGWATRGMGRGTTRKQLMAAFESSQRANFADSSFGKRAIYKATRRTKQDTGPLIERNTQGRYTTLSHRSTQVVRNRIRGGPIKPNPFVYDAISYQAEGVFNSFARQIEQRARIEALL